MSSAGMDRTLSTKKTSGFVRRPAFSCISFKGPHKTQCLGCRNWSSHDMFSVQRHELEQHGDLYTAAQLLAASELIGTKGTQVSRWFAQWEIVSGVKHEGKVDPYYHPPLWSDSKRSITNVSNAMPQIAFTSRNDSLYLVCSTLLLRIIGLVGLVKDVARTVRDSRKDMDAVSRELTSMSLSIETFQNDSTKVKYPPSLIQSLVDALHNCDLVASGLHDCLSDLRIQQTLNQDFQWTMETRIAVNRLRVSLEAHKSAIDVAIDMSSLIVTPKGEPRGVFTNFQNPQSRIAPSSIPGLIEQINVLRKEVEDLKSQTAKPNVQTGFILERFLGESSTYAESVADFVTAKSQWTGSGGRADQVDDGRSTYQGTSSSVLNASASDVLAPPYELHESTYPDFGRERWKGNTWTRPSRNSKDLKERPFEDPLAQLSPSVRAMWEDLFHGRLGPSSSLPIAPPVEQQGQDYPPEIDEPERTTPWTAEKKVEHNDRLPEHSLSGVTLELPENPYQPPLPWLSVHGEALPPRASRQTRKFERWHYPVEFPKSGQSFWHPYPEPPEETDWKDVPAL